MRYMQSAIDVHKRMTNTVRREILSTLNVSQKRKGENTFSIFICMEKLFSDDIVPILYLWTGRSIWLVSYVFYRTFTTKFRI